MTQRSVAVWVLKRRVVLSVAEPGEGETQQRPDQHIYMKERDDNTRASSLDRAGFVSHIEVK